VSFPPSAEPLADVKRVLGVFAHPDDADFGAGGTVARWVADGIEVGYVIATRGDAGGFDDTPRELMPVCGRPSSAPPRPNSVSTTSSSWTATSTAG
jgi:hypothetical protein